jgi:hypothetical protein
VDAALEAWVWEAVRVDVMDRASAVDRADVMGPAWGDSEDDSQEAGSREDDLQEDGDSAAPAA